MKRDSWVEIVRDFRVLYHCSAYEVGYTISYSEALVLVHSLLKETGSLYTAKKMGFKRHFSMEEVAVLDLVQLYIGANSKKGRKPKPIPKPYDKIPQNLGKAISKNKFVSMLEAISSGKAKVRPLKK